MALFFKIAKSKPLDLLTLNMRNAKVSRVSFEFGVLISLFSASY